MRTRIQIASIGNKVGEKNYTFCSKRGKNRAGRFVFALRTNSIPNFSCKPEHPAGCSPTTILYIHTDEFSFITVSRGWQWWGKLVSVSKFEPIKDRIFYISLLRTNNACMHIVCYSERPYHFQCCHPHLSSRMKWNVTTRYRFRCFLPSSVLKPGLRL